MAPTRQPQLSGPTDGLTTPQLAAVFRHEVPALCQEILDEVCRSIPDYAALIHGPYREPVQRAVESNVVTFVDHLVAPTKPSPRRDELCRTLGKLQVPFDTGLSRLEAAFRIGVRVAWRRMIRVFRRYQVPSLTQSALVDLLFGYVDEMTDLARDGYVRAMADDTSAVDRHRRRLARALLAGQVAPRALAQLAGRASWPVPAELTVVVLGVGSRPDAAALPGDALLDASDQPAVVVPGEVGRSLERSLLAAAGGVRIAIGPTVAPDDAAASLRWAVEALRLADAGTITAAAVVRSDDHILRLWLGSDPVIAERLRRRQLAPFDSLTPTQRRRMLATLQAWLTHRGDVALIAADLDLHPQTVRYRMRVLRQLVGASLDDPEWRLTTELTLRTEGPGLRVVG
jgi:hypothetical protein